MPSDGAHRDAVAASWRICQFHLKDKGYMGEGKVDFPAILQAIRDYRTQSVLYARRLIAH